VTTDVSDSADVRGDPYEVDAPWMTRVLQRAGVARGATVDVVRVDAFIGTGQMARSVRLGLEWNDGEGRPPSVVAKVPSDDPTARTTGFAHSSYRTEWAFYNELAPTVAIRTPACYAALYDEAKPDFVIVMEDLAGSRQGDQFAGLTVDQAALAMEQAAGLHGPRWGDPTLRSFMPDRPKGAQSAEYLGLLYGAMVDPFIERLGAGLDPDVVDLALRLAPQIATWATGSDTAETIIHLDFRPDNFLFAEAPDAPPLVVVDWQTVTSGLAMFDVAYVLGGSFLPADRSACERALVREYLDRLTTHGVDYDEDTAWTDYRRGALWGLVMSVIATSLAANTERGNEMLTVMAARAGRHALDLDSLAVVAAL